MKLQTPVALTVIGFVMLCISAAGYTTMEAGTEFNPALLFIIIVSFFGWLPVLIAAVVLHLRSK
jgi:hypothetical protein